MTFLQDCCTLSNIVPFQEIFSVAAVAFVADVAFVAPAAVVFVAAAVPP